MNFNAEKIPKLPSERILNYKDWESFVYHGELIEEIPSLIRDSWKRCSERNVDPIAPKLANVLSPKEFNIRRRRRHDLIEVARTTIRDLYKIVEGSGFLISLTDEEGVILLIHGDPIAKEKSERINFVEGAVWSEEQVGTNAVGTAVVMKKPVQIVGGEHYCVTQHEITCSACPIFDCNRSMVGTLNMSAACDKVHLHTLGMVVAAARSIENQLMINKAMRDVVTTNTILKTTLYSIPEGIVTIDEKGLITQLNSKAIEFLGFDLKLALGKSIDEIISGQKLSRVVDKGVVIENIEVIIENEKVSNYLTISAYPIMSEKEVIEGAVLVLICKEHINNLVNKVTGAQAQLTFQSIIGKGKKLEKAKDIARSAALTNSTVLLLGESGTGKELFAQSIHNSSHRKGPFVAVNCSAIPRSLIESELFGYEAGSFTGADRNGRPGKFERANGGTIFLDEIGDMPFDLQAILLRVLQEKQVVRVGGYKPISIDLRVIAATNKDLASKVLEGTFREDLYFRLNVVTVKIPPLRERIEDIPLLIERMLPGISQRLGKKVTGVSPQAIRYLQEYKWPGNVRELENILERGVIVAQESIVGIEDIPESVVQGKSSLPMNSVELLSLAQVERRAIIDTLAEISSIVEAAQILGVSRSTLYRKMNEYQILIPNKVVE